jgi:hypothetical protein
MSELPWVKIEFSSAPFASNADKKAGFLRALERFFTFAARRKKAAILGNHRDMYHRGTFAGSFGYI